MPLPIEAIKSDFCQALSEKNTLILSAPPGAGKSTCLPLWLLEHPALHQQKIYLLQPRRLAVKNIAAYLAKQLNEKVGETVGYRLRDDVKVSKHTRLEVITEGIMTKIIQEDPELAATGLIVFDEFHERSLQGDFSFALSREVQTALRDDLKILLMSATLNTDYLSQALPDAQLLQSEGRSFPIDVYYDAPKSHQYWREHALAVIKKHIQSHDGSILVFLPGIADINYLVTHLSDYKSDEVHITPLYGELSLKDQQLAITPCQEGHKKVVLATNIAETSLTISGINLVIDSGWEKVAVFDNSSLMNKLTQVQISKASATQRAGRAGRLMAGKCIRLYPKDDFERRPQQAISAIQQADLLPILIEAARWGVNELKSLPLLELPSPIKEIQTWQELQNLAVVDERNILTVHGEEVATLPCHPRFSHMILMANKQSTALSLLACLMAALLEERDIFKGEQALSHCELSARLRHIVQTHRNAHSGVIKRIMNQAKRLAKCLQLTFSLHEFDVNQAGLLLAYAYPERVAKARGKFGDFICVNGKGINIDEQDPLAAEPFIVAAQIQKNKNSLTVRLAQPISGSVIEQVFTEQIKHRDTAKFDDNQSKIIIQQETYLGAVILSTQAEKTVDNTAVVSKLWCDLVEKKGLSLLSWSKDDISLRARWQWLNNFFPEYGLPSVDEASLLNQLTVWFSPYVGEIKNKGQLSKLKLSEMLLTLLDYQQQKVLKQAAPTVYVGPTGRHCPISYSEERSPKVSLPMQELYGLSVSPCVGDIQGVKTNNGPIALLLEILSPAQRPIQVTQDLAVFWSGSYDAVKKDMKSRYPKHYWPDDPANAQATNKTKRHITE